MTDDVQPAPSRTHRQRLEGVLGFPATEGNRIDVLHNGEEIFPAMLEAIEQATRSIDLLTFIYWDGRVGARFASALAERARSGVRVRVLLDALGARRMDRVWIREMRDAGAIVEWFRPLGTPRVWRWPHRTHRKVLVCDEVVAFTGGVGIADQWDGDARGPNEWRDTHFRVTGPAVDGLRAAFADNWLETERPLWDADKDHFPPHPRAGDTAAQVVRGESQAGGSDITMLVHTLLRTAERRLRIATAYFAPGRDTLHLLCEASRRGVDVEILLPGPHADKRFVQLASEDVYTKMFEAGISVACFQPSMLHAKIMLVDDAVACVGSANFNSRSLEFDEEINLVLFDEELVATLDSHFSEDWARSEELDPARWRRRNLAQRGLERGMSLVAWFM